MKREPFITTRTIFPVNSSMTQPNLSARELGDAFLNELSDVLTKFKTDGVREFHDLREMVMQVTDVVETTHTHIQRLEAIESKLASFNAVVAELRELGVNPLASLHEQDSTVTPETKRAKHEPATSAKPEVKHGYPTRVNSVDSEAKKLERVNSVKSVFKHTKLSERATLLDLVVVVDSEVSILHYVNYMLENKQHDKFLPFVETGNIFREVGLSMDGLIAYLPSTFPEGRLLKAHNATRATVSYPMITVNGHDMFMMIADCLPDEMREIWTKGDVTDLFTTDDMQAYRLKHERDILPIQQRIKVYFDKTHSQKLDNWKKKCM
jgi:hypothetical protein